MGSHGQTDVTTSVRRVDPDESGLAEAITLLVNRSYAGAQGELFTRPSPRTSVGAIGQVIARGELVVAERADAVVGVVVTRDLDELTGFFGMLAVPPDAASTGVARQLLDALESEAITRGRSRMELDLLMPTPATPHQSRLREWYERRAYVAVRERPFGDVDPEAAAFLRQPTQLVRFAKTLAQPGVR